MDAYATTDELTAFLGTSATLPDDADRLLARASELMDRKVRAPFTIDKTTGIPTDPAVATVMADATCAQVEFWIETGEHHDIDGLAGTNVNVAGYTGERSPELAPRAERILSSIPLFAVPVIVNVPQTKPLATAGQIG